MQFLSYIHIIVGGTELTIVVTYQVLDEERVSSSNSSYSLTDHLLEISPYSVEC